MLLNHALNIATEGIEPDDKNDVFFDSMELAESYFDMVNAFEDVDSAFEELRELEVAYEEFTNTLAFISENGMTKQIAMFIDSENQIISKEEFENLSDIPEKVPSVEGKIADWAKKVWDMIVKAFNAVIGFFGKMFQAVYKFFTNAQKGLEKVLEKLKGKSDADFDQDKLKKAETKCYAKSDLLLKEFEVDVSKKFENLINVAEDMKKELEGAKEVSDEDITKILTSISGKLTKLEGDIDSICNDVKLSVEYKVSNKPSLSAPLVSLKLGKSEFDNIEGKDLLKAVKSPKDYVSYVESFLKVYKSSNEEYKKIEKKISGLSKDMVKFAKAMSNKVEDESGEKFKTYLAKQINTYMSVIQKLISKYVKYQQKHAYLLLSAGKKVTSCLKKD